MVQVVNQELRLAAEMLEREFRNAHRMLRSFPAERIEDRPPDCSRSGRELAWAFVERERRLLYVLRGRTAELGTSAPESLLDIQAEYENAHRETRAALAVFTEQQWNEVIRGPAGLGGWERARRGELVWMSWKDLVHHTAHFAVHLRLARQDDAMELARGAAELRATA